jgi:hypothetical protein
MIHIIKFNGIIPKKKYLHNKEVKLNNYSRILYYIISNEIACSNWNDLGFLPIL